MNKKKHVLILGGSSDIGAEVIKDFLSLNWNVTAHFNKNSKKLKTIQRKSKNLKLTQFNFANYNSFVTILKLFYRLFYLVQADHPVASRGAGRMACWKVKSLCVINTKQF